MRTAFVTMILAIIALMYFNPDMDDFRLFVEDRSEQFLLEETGDDAFGRALSGIGSSLAGTFVDRITTRRNFFVFSTYTIDLDGPQEEGNEWRFVGIAGRFLTTEEPEGLRRQKS